MAQRILIVEDDPDGQALVAHVINYLSIAHDVVEDGESASRQLFETDTDYQVVIIDLQLPGKDGWELLNDIRSNANTRDMTCIALTAFHTSKIREEALKLGFNAYFSKPLDVTHFVQALETLL